MNNITGKIIQSSTTISTSSELVQISSNGGEYQLYIDSDLSWRIEDLPNYISASSNRGVSSQTITLTFTKNNSTENARIGSFKIVNSGNTEYIVNVLQEAAVIEYEYVFETDETSFEVSNEASTIQLSVTSHRTPYVNGVVYGDKEDVLFYLDTELDWIDLSGNTLTISKNEGYNRSGSFVLIQNGSYKRIDATIAQEGAVIEYKYRIESDKTEVNAPATPSTQYITINAYCDKLLNGVVVETTKVNVHNVTYNENITSNEYSFNFNNNTSESEIINSVTFKPIVDPDKPSSFEVPTITVTLKQEAGVARYEIKLSNANNIPASGGSTNVNVVFDTIWNNIITATNSVCSGYTITEISDSANSFSASGTNGTITISADNNTTEFAKSASYTISKSGFVSSDFSVSQLAGSKIYSDISASLSYPSNAAAAGGSCSPTINYSQSYKWNNVGDSIQVANSDLKVSSYSMSSTTGAQISESTGVVTWNNNTSTSIRTSGDISITITGLGNKSKKVTATCSQNAGSVEYKIKTTDVSTFAANGESKTSNVTYDTIWNGITTATGTTCTDYTITESSDSSSSFNASGTTGIVTISAINNTSESSKSATYTISKSGYTGSTISVSQLAGKKVYSDITVNLSYATNAAASGGNCNPTLSYSQTYTWNNTGSAIAIDSSNLTKSAYSLVGTNGASINSSTGVVTWTNNTSTSVRTSGNISITITGLGSKSKTVTATCKQNAGTVEYKILGASLTFVPKGESRSQAITYDTIWNGIKTSNSACSDYTITESSDSTGAFSASGTSGTVTVSVGNNTTTSARSASYTISKSGYTSGTISASQSAGSVAYYINDVTASNIAAAGGSTTAKITYTTKWNDIATKTDSSLTDYSITESSDSTGRFSASGTSGTVTISATNNMSTSAGSAKYTISKSGYTSGAVNVSQIAGSVRYLIDTVSTDAISASGGSKSVNVTYDTEWNGIITATNTALATPYTITESSDSSGAFSATSSDSSVTVTASENKSTSTRSAQYTISKSGYVDGKVTSSQSAGTKSYAAWVVSISANKTSGIASTGGTSTITASASRTWGWNGATSGGGTETGTVKLSIPTSVTGASLSGSTLTWAENKTTSARSVTVRATCNEDTSKYKDITISQSAGYYTYGNITISSFAYGAISAVGGNVSPSITYSQPYGWNGATSGAGTINGNGDDDYTTYAETTTHSALTVNTTTGVVTWTKNNATAGSVDAARSGVITATVTRNGKTATKTATTTQNAEAISSYGNWSFSVTANTSSIAATGGSVTFTISRPTRTITYDTGDTQTQTATSGTFALTRSNSSFTLSTSSISMTSSSLPTFTLSVGATGAAAVAAISSTVTAAFTASNPTTGTTTKSVTSGSITRAESKHISTNYRINGFSVSTASFNAAANSTTLSITTQRQYVYTGNQNSSWSSFNPGSGLSVSCGTGGSAGTITYGNPSTCTISIAANTGAARTISVSGSYTNGGSGSLNISQSADAIKSTSYSNVTAGKITNTTIPASGTTSNYTATAGNGSQVLTYSWVSGKANTTETKTISPSHSSISSTASSKGTTTSDVTTVKSQAVTWASLDGTSSKNATGTMYIYQAANKANASYDTPTISAYSYATFAAAGATKTPTVSYSQTPRYTSGSAGSAITSGGTLAFTASSSVSGCTLNSGSTGSITWANNTSTSARSAKSVLTVKVTMNGKTSSSFTCTACEQSAGYYSYATPSVSLSYSNKNAASGNVSPSLSYSQTYGWNGSTSGVGTVTSGGSVSYSETTAHSNASVNSSTGVVTWDANTSSSNRSVGITASVTVNGKTGSKAATSTQLADAISSTSYGNVTAGKITNATIPAGGTTTNYTATAGNGSQVITYSWVSGKANTSETKTIAPSVASISATAGSKGTDVSSTTTVKSQAVTWTGSGSKSASGTMYIYQAANAITSYGNVTVTNHGSVASDIPASGGDRTASGGAGSQTITYTSGATRAGSVTCGSYTKVSASKLPAEAKARTHIGNSTATLTGEGSKTATCSVAVYQQANAITSYGNVTVTNHGSVASDIPASGGDRTASGGTGSQTITYTSGSTRAGSVSCGSYTKVSASKLPAEAKARTHIGNSTATLTGEGSKTATASVAVYQQANAITSYGNVTVSNHGSASDIPASGGDRTASGGSGTQTITYTSGATRAGSVTCGSYSKVSASSLGTTVKVRTKIGDSTATLTGEGSKTATCSVAIYQAANAVTSYSLPQPLGIKYDKLIPAGGGTATPSFSYQQIATYTSGSTSTITSGASISYARAYGVRNDPEFYNGNNSISRYDNNSSGKTTLTRVTSGYPSGIPNVSGACLKISNVGSGASPGLGGWYFAYVGTAGQTYICTFDAYVPTGRNIIFATNSIGSGGTQQWLTPNAGLGKWATYSFQVYFGTSPSSSFFFYLDGSVGSSSSPVNWWVSDAHLAQVSNVSASSPTVNTSTGAVTLGSLGTTVQSATANAYGTMCATITLNGKTSKVVLAPTQQANAITSYGNVSVTSHGSVSSDIPASGGDRTASGGTGSQTITYTSTSTRAGTVTCGSYNKVSASSLGTTTKVRTAVGTSSATLTGEGGKTATASVTVYQAANAVTSYTYGSWGGGAISFSSTGALSAGADSRTVTIQPWTRTKTPNYTSGSAGTATTDYYTGSVTVSENGSYTSLNATSYTGSSSAKTLTLTKTTCGTTSVSATTVTVSASGGTSTSNSLNQTANTWWYTALVNMRTTWPDVPAYGPNHSGSAKVYYDMQYKYTSGSTGTWYDYWVTGYGDTANPFVSYSFTSTAGSSYYDCNGKGCIAGPNLGTTEKARTKIGTLKITVNTAIPYGLSGTYSGTFDIYQAANTKTWVSNGSSYISVYNSLTASQTSFGKSGGSATLSCTFRDYGYYKYTSGSNSSSQYRYDIVPTYSLVSAVSGFSISGSTLNVAATTVDRSCQVIASYGGVSTSPITISQSSSDLTINTISIDILTAPYDSNMTELSISVNGTGWSNIFWGTLYLESLTLFYDIIRVENKDGTISYIREEQESLAIYKEFSMYNGRFDFDGWAISESRCYASVMIDKNHTFIEMEGCHYINDYEQECEYYNLHVGESVVIGTNIYTLVVNDQSSMKDISECI